MRILTLSLLLWALPALAEHLPGGNISVRCVSGNQHEVTLKLWRECTGVPMIAQSVSFVSSCGVTFSLNIPLISVANVSPVCEGQADQTTCDGGTLIGIEEYTYRITVFLSPCNFWRIFWNTCCRFPALNLQGSQGIYIEALVNNLGGTCIEYPSFSDNTPPLVCVNQPVSYDPGVVFTQGQQLRFRLIEARRLLNADPQNLDIQSVSYQSPFTGPEPYTGLAIDSLTGQITFTPLGQGYIVCVIAIEVSDANGAWRGTIMRDFPFIAQVCDNAVPDAASGTVTNLAGAGAATGPYEVLACGQVCFDAAITDTDAAQIVSLTSNIADAIPGATFNVVEGNPAVAAICVDASGLAAGQYLFTISALDDACPVRGAQSFSYVLTVAESDVDAGDDASADICPGATLDLSTLVTGDPGGAWSEGPVVSTAGTYTYTVSGICGDDIATFTISEANVADAGADAQVDICQGAQTDLAAFVTGASGGVWSGGSSVVSLGGTYTYTVSNACGSDEAAFTVTVFAPASAGLDNQILVCPQAAPFQMIDSLLGSAEPGGSWTLDGAPVDPVFDPSMGTEGEYTYSVTSPVCGDASALLSINFLDPTDPYCLTLGVTEQWSTMRVHPNPSDGLLLLDLSANSRAEVLDASGRLVHHASPGIGASSVVLPASLTNGSYALRITRPDGSVTVARFELIR
jgi:hypothetical protein